MKKLSNSERLIINQLIDNGLFMQTPVKSSNEISEAINVLKRPKVQNKISNYLNDLLGIYPEGIQDNLLLLIGARYESAETVHVILATLKAVINMPEIQDGADDRTVLARTVIRQVQSEVMDLDESEIRQIIIEIFVDRFRIFSLDYPEILLEDENREVDEYWNINLEFNSFAQAIVNYMTRKKSPNLNDIQKVNRALLVNKFVSSKTSNYLWEAFLNKKDQIIEQWRNLDRFDLECGDNYVLLLDKNRQKVKSKPAIVAIVIANTIKSGISEADLNNLIRSYSKSLFSKSNINIYSVKDALKDFDLIHIRNGFVFPTPIIKRFKVEDKG